MDKSSKGRQVTSKDEEVETNTEEYVSITKDDISTDVRKEKSHKRPNVKIPRNVYVIVNDENLEEKRRKKMKVDHYQIVKANSEYPSENSKESREIITSGVDLEDGIIKTKQKSIRHNLTKTNLIEGDRTF